MAKFKRGDKFFYGGAVGSDHAKNHPHAFIVDDIILLEERQKGRKKTLDTVYKMIINDGKKKGFKIREKYIQDYLDRGVWERGSTN